MYDSNNDNFEKKKPTIKKFLKTHRLHLFLAVCILAAGMLTFLISTNDTAGDDLNVQKQKSPTLEEQLNESQAPANALESSPMPEASPSESASPSAETTGNTKAAVKLTMPVDGQVISAFSGEDLVLNKTLNMWATHNGIDISCKAGDPVKAALAGTIKAVRTDNTMGEVVEIEHTDKQVTVYAGFSEVTVKAGDKVNAGGEIGKVGTPAFEANQGTHIHFEYLVDGKYVDPTTKMETK